jgi:hypothetical protein
MIRIAKSTQWVLANEQLGEKPYDMCLPTSSHWKNHPMVAFTEQSLEHPPTGV